MAKKFSLILKKKPQNGSFLGKTDTVAFNAWLRLMIGKKFEDPAVLKEEVDDKLEAGVPVVLLSGVGEFKARFHATSLESFGATVEVRED